MKNFDTDAEKKALELGAEYQKQYLGYCIKRYPDKLKKDTLPDLFKDIADYINGKPYIPNTDNNITFKDFCNKFKIIE